MRSYARSVIYLVFGSSVGQRQVLVREQNYLNGMNVDELKCALIPRTT